MEGQNKQAMIRAWVIGTHEHLQKTLFSPSAQIRTIYEYKYMEKADQVKHLFVFFYKPGFPR